MRRAQQGLIKFDVRVSWRLNRPEKILALEASLTVKLFLICFLIVFIG
jgi:hypothetical protein